MNVGTHKSQKVSNTLALEFQAVVSPQTWKSRLGPLEEQQVPLTATPPPAPALVSEDGVRQFIAHSGGWAAYHHSIYDNIGSMSFQMSGF